MGEEESVRDRVGQDLGAGVGIKGDDWGGGMESMLHRRYVHRRAE